MFSAFAILALLQTSFAQNISAPAGAYRAPLFALLKKGGYTFTFVGTLTENPTANSRRRVRAIIRVTAAWAWTGSGST
jgi:hypothetical protein